MDKRVDRRTVAKGAGALTGFAAARTLLQATAEAADPATPGGTAEQSLYERVGGIFAIAAVVDRFSDAIITNPKPYVNPALEAWQGGVDVAPRCVRGAKPPRGHPRAEATKPAEAGWRRGARNPNRWRPQWGGRRPCLSVGNAAEVGRCLGPTPPTAKSANE